DAVSAVRAGSTVVSATRPANAVSAAAVSAAAVSATRAGSVCDHDRGVQPLLDHCLCMCGYFRAVLLGLIRACWPYSRSGRLDEEGTLCAYRNRRCCRLHDRWDGDRCGLLEFPLLLINTQARQFIHRESSDSRKSADIGCGPTREVSATRRTR